MGPEAWRRDWSEWGPVAVPPIKIWGVYEQVAETLEGHVTSTAPGHAESYPHPHYGTPGNLLYYLAHQEHELKLSQPSQGALGAPDHSPEPRRVPKNIHYKDYTGRYHQQVPYPHPKPTP
jgi:hypothetical protein